MINTLFIIIVFIVVLDYLLDQLLSFLNRKAWSNQLPEDLSDVYDPETYRKSQDYKRENEKLGIITSTVSFILLIGMLLLNGFAFIDSFVRGMVTNELLVSLIFFGILYFASDILSMPFSVYDVFVIEEKFGFNKVTPKLFVFDKLKGYLLTVLIGGGLLTLFIWFYQALGPLFWLYSWGAITIFMILMLMFYSNLIVPLFNKQSPLEDGELKTSIQEFCKKADFKLKDVYVIDGSKRSTKANAYFTGLGSKKRIVLYDTLINQMTTAEITAVLAHEIGHYKKKHTLQSLILSFFQNGITLYILSLLLNYPEFSEALKVAKPGLHIGIIIFAALYTPISTIVGILMNMLSRKNEYQADAFAAEFGLGGELISSLKKLSRNNFSNLTPHPAYVFFHYSHPTLLQRIRAIRKK